MVEEEIKQNSLLLTKKKMSMSNGCIYIYIYIGFAMSAIAYVEGQINNGREFRIFLREKIPSIFFSIFSI